MHYADTWHGLLLVVLYSKGYIHCVCVEYDIPRTLSSVVLGCPRCLYIIKFGAGVGWAAGGAILPCL